MFLSTQVTNVGRTNGDSCKIMAVSPTMLESTFSEYFVVHKVGVKAPKGNSALTFDRQLYTARGMQSVVAGASYEKKLGFDTEVELKSGEQTPPPRQ